MAVPYVSPGARKRLRLQSGDVLVTRFDNGAIQAGQTDPKEIAHYIRKGVEVHNEPWLHAKVYVSPKRAVICSANVSANSEKGLLEAGLEVTNRKVIGDARRFVQTHRGNVIGLAYARSKIPLFRSGGQARRATSFPKAPVGPSHWIVNLHLSESTEQELDASRRSKKKAVSRMKDREAFRLDNFTFFGKWPARQGDYVVQIVRDGRLTWVEAPAQILVIDRFANKYGQSLSVVLEMRKRVRTRSLSQMDAAVRPDTLKRFPRVSRSRQIRNDALRRAILGEWPKVEETNVAR